MGSIPKGDRLRRETVGAARDFAGLELWRDYADDEIFGVRAPGEKLPLYCSILGGAGEEFGLGIFRGETALDDYRRLIFEAEGGDDFIDSVHSMSLTMDRLRTVPRHHRKFLGRAGVQARRDAIVPVFLAKEPGRLGREINQTEALLFLYTIRGILVAFEDGLLKPGTFGDADDVLVLDVSGDPLQPDVSVDSAPLPGGPFERIPESVFIPPDLDRLPRRDVTWQVGFRPVPTAIRGDDRTVRALLVVETGSGQALGVEVLAGRDVEGAVARFISIVEGDNVLHAVGLPERVVISSQSLFDALAPALAAVDVPCVYDPDPQPLGRAFESLSEAIARGGVGEPDPADDIDPTFVPAPDDLPGWRDAERRLVDRLVRRVVDGDLMTRRARVRYFGCEEEAEFFLAPHHPASATGSFIEWIFVDYRPTKKSRTLAEKMLDEDLPAAERVLVEARTRARPSLYRVEHVERGESVSLVDIIDGSRAEVFDLAFSRTVDPGLVVPARVIEAGEYRLLQLLGPVILPFEVDHVLGLLESLGLPPVADAMRESSHLLGRLWEPVEEWRENPAPARLTNTDGDELELQTASFSVEDEEAVRLALEARDDIEENEAEGCLGWLRRKPNPKLAGGETVLGRIEFVAGELLLDVNSTNRLMEARFWLEQIPGVAYLRRTVTDLDDEPPMDHVLSRKEIPPPPPEAAAALREMFQARHMEWLDESIPLFGGKSPREMCASEGGRRRVAAYIRAMPDPGGPLGTDIAGIPREAMLKELGLE